VGKKSLDKAISATSSNADVTVTWRPFLLRPEMPLDGKLKQGNPVGDRLREAGVRAGIDFTGLTPRYPNTTQFHALMDWTLETAGPETQHRLSEVLFRHYFTDGRYPDNDNLKAAAVEVGLDAGAALKAVNDDARKSKVRTEAINYSRRGVSGVPFFIINGEPAFSGAQPPEVFVDEIDKAL